MATTSLNTHFQILSRLGGSANGPLKVPEPTETHFFTSGPILSFFPQINENGFTFENHKISDDLVDTLVGSTVDIQHVKPGYGIRDQLVPDQTNTTVGAILMAKKTEDGIFLVNKIERTPSKALGFTPEDFGPDKVLGQLSQECDNDPLKSEWIVVDKNDSTKIVARMSFEEGLANGFPLGNNWAGSHVENGTWKYHYFGGHPVYMSVAPKSFSGVGHVVTPADPSAKIMHLSASNNVTTTDDEQHVTGKHVEKFIQKAIKHKGALTEKAKAAGQSIDEFAKAHEHDGDQTGEQSRFYLHTLKPAAKNVSYVPGMDEGPPGAPTGMIYADEATHDDNLWNLDQFQHPDLLNADVSKFENDGDDDDKVPDDHFAACYSMADYDNKVEGKPSVVKIRAYRIKNDKGELDRKRLIAAYRSIMGRRGNMETSASLPPNVRKHAKAIIRQGLNLTNKHKGVLKSMSTFTNILSGSGMVISDDQEREILAAAEQALLRNQKVFSAADMDAANASVADLKAQIATLTASVDTLKNDLTTVTTERDTLTASLNEIKQNELAQSRFAQLNEAMPFSDDERKSEAHADYVKNLASLSEDRFHIELQARTIKKLSAAVNGRVVASAPMTNPVPALDHAGEGQIDAFKSIFG